MTPITPTPPNQPSTHCEAPSSPTRVAPSSDKPIQPGPPNPQSPHPTDSAALPSGVTQATSQPQTQTPQIQDQAPGSPGPSPAQGQVSGTHPPREPSPEAAKPSSTTPTPSSPTASSPSSPQPQSSSMEGSPVSEPPVPGFATLGRRLMLSGPDPHPHNNHQQQQQQHGSSHHHYPGMESGNVGYTDKPYSPAMETTERHSTATFPTSAGCYPANAPQLHPSSYSNYSIVSLPHPQPPLPEKRRQPSQPGSPNGGVGTLRPALGHVPPSTATTIQQQQQQQQHHVTFSPTVGEMAPPAGQSEGGVSVETEMANRVSVKFVQDSSKFWYKPGITRDQGECEGTACSRSFFYHILILLDIRYTWNSVQFVPLMSYKCSSGAIKHPTIALDTQAGLRCVLI